MSDFIDKGNAQELADSTYPEHAIHKEYSKKERHSRNAKAEMSKLVSIEKRLEQSGDTNKLQKIQHKIEKLEKNGLVTQHIHPTTTNIGSNKTESLV